MTILPCTSRVTQSWLGVLVLSVALGACARQDTSVNLEGGSHPASAAPTEAQSFPTDAPPASNPGEEAGLDCRRIGALPPSQAEAELIELGYTVTWQYERPGGPSRTSRPPDTAVLVAVVPMSASEVTLIAEDPRSGPMPSPGDCPDVIEAVPGEHFPAPTGTSAS